jgi:Uncharacterized protein conserved in bacteria
MYRVKDFYMLEVININGKRIGFIKDLLLDFNNGKVKGFVISSYNIFKKNQNVFVEDIISFSEIMVIKDVKKYEGLTFKEIKDIDVLDPCGNIIGMLEDILFDRNFKINAVIITSGFLRKFYKGKIIALLNQIIIGDNNILYADKERKCRMLSMPHSLIGVDCYE